jgi:ligand-binding SRPBCC domain-containing protein
MSIRIERQSNGNWRLTAVQRFAQSREELFPFFADAGNLEAITPPQLHFRILTPQPIAMATGTLIDYRLRLHGAPIRWRTRIAAWEPPHRFVDEQIRGPYRLWHHEHTFEERDGQTVMTDSVDYRSIGGRLVHRLFIARDLESIFAYRMKVLAERFGTIDS